MKAIITASNWARNDQQKLAVKLQTLNIHFVTLHSITCLENSDPENTNLRPRKLHESSDLEDAFADNLSNLLSECIFVHAPIASRIVCTKQGKAKIQMAQLVDKESMV